MGFCERLIEMDFFKRSEAGNQVFIGIKASKRRKTWWKWNYEDCSESHATDRIDSVRLLFIALYRIQTSHLIQFEFDP